MKKRLFKRLAIGAVALFALACGQASAQNAPIAKRYEWRIDDTGSVVTVVDMPDGTRCYAFPAAGNVLGGCVLANPAYGFHAVSGASSGETSSGGK